jgi:DNA repair exonuclease SbcCD ATPase subunit
MTKDQTQLLAEEAFWTLLPKGTQPTVETVNAWLRDNGHGGRNRNVISDTLKACWAQLATRVREMNTLPGIPAETVQLVLRLRDDMLALAKKEFEDESTEIRLAADARVTAAQAELAAVRAAADEAKQAKRESDSAYLVLQDEHQRVVGEAKSLRSQLEDASRQITTRDVQLGQAHEALEQEKKHREEDRNATHNERQRLNLELDQLRTANTAQTRAFERTFDKAQAQIDAAAIRERELRDEAGRLQAEIGTLRGAQQILKDHNTELTAERESARSEATTHSQRAATAEEKLQGISARLEECLAELASRPALSVDQLQQLVADSYVAGANSAARPAKTKDPLEGLADRAMEYASKHSGTAAAGGRARSTRK